MAVQLLKRLFTTTEYDQMIHAGILGEDDRVELLNGEIVEMSPIGSYHAAGVDRLTALFSQRLGRAVIVRVQSPIRLNERSEPQPDLAILHYRADYYARAHPEPEDVLLIVEVAESSADTDRVIKVPMYARAKIPQVLLVDLADDCVYVSSNPMPSGYAVTDRLVRGQTLSINIGGDFELTVDEILG